MIYPIPLTSDLNSAYIAWRGCTKGERICQVWHSRKRKAPESGVFPPPLWSGFEYEVLRKMNGLFELISPGFNRVLCSSVVRGAGAQALYPDYASSF